MFRKNDGKLQNYIKVLVIQQLKNDNQGLNTDYNKNFKEQKGRSGIKWFGNFLLLHSRS